MSFDDLDKMVSDEILKDEHSCSNTKVALCEILIVDDDATILEALDVLLGDKYKVVLCRSGKEAIEAVSIDTHAVILDIKMRVLDGFDTFLELKKKSADLPIIFHSAYQDIKDPYDVINEFRPFGYIKKDGRDVELLDTVASATQYYSQEREIESLLKQVEKANKKLNLIAKKKALALEEMADELRSIAASEYPPLSNEEI